MKNRRRFLRNNATQQEIKLWNELKDKKLGIKIRRQVSIGHYSVDFCCLRLKIIIEIDRDSHLQPEQKDYDRVRTEYVEKLGFKEIRFTNKEIDQDLLNVISKIKALV